MDKTIEKPRITVLMACYNSEKYLQESMDSILGQTYPNFEFIIIDDGSTDKSPYIIKSYADPRIKFIKNEKNMGHTYCLNLGLSKAQGEYVARMDSDDISLSTRLEEQVKFMDSYPEIAVCGTWTKTIGQLNGHINRFFTDPEDVKANLLFYTSLAHPTVIIRKSILEKYYLRYGIDIDRDENSEDYNLWVKLSKYEKLANIPKVLLLYRLHETNVTSVHKQKNRESASAIRLRELTDLGLSPTREDMIIHNSTKSDLNEQEKWLEKIIEANKVNKIYNNKALNKIIYHRWFEACLSHTKEGLPVYKKFTSSPLYKFKDTNKTTDNIKILIKSLLRK
ncbi:MAG: glycosyltransferase family 2 protein [Minisyncoccia bacterium]